MLVLNSFNFSIICISKLFNFQIFMYFDFFNLTILRRLSKNSTLFKNVDNSKGVQKQSFSSILLTYEKYVNIVLLMQSSVNISQRVHRCAYITKPKKQLLASVVSRKTCTKD